LWRVGLLSCERQSLRMGTEQISLLGEGPPRPSRWRSLTACLLSIVASLAVLLPSTHILLHLPQSWDQLAATLQAWLASAKLDAAVSEHLLSCLAWAGEAKSNLLAGVATSALLHLFLSLLLLAGIITLSRPLILPWLISQGFVLGATATTFTACTFLSLFVSLPLAVVCPMAGGLLLGLFIHLWRAVAATYADSKRHRKPWVVRSVGGSRHLSVGGSDDRSRGLQQHKQRPEVFAAVESNSGKGRMFINASSSSREGANILCKS